MFLKTHFIRIAAPLLLAPSLHAAEIKIPDPLAAPDGQVATTPDAWMANVRPPTLQNFREQIYGVRPVEKPADFQAKVIREDPQALDGTATLK